MIETGKTFAPFVFVLVLYLKHVYGRGDIGLDPLRIEYHAIEVRDCPGDITVTMEPCERSDVTKISWTEPKAISQDSEVTLVAQNIQSGSLFHAGKTKIVEYIFEDERGNRVTCNFTVRVLRAHSECFITPGPRFVTFDGFNFGCLSDCMYTIVKSYGDTGLPDFEVTGDFLETPGDEERFALREMRLYYRRNEFTLREEKTVYLNGKKITYPLVNFDGVSIYKNHPNYILLTDFGLSIKFDGERNGVIFLPSSQPVCGLCGTNDFKPLNDIKHLSNGSEAVSVTDFVDSWRLVKCGASKNCSEPCEDGSLEKIQAVEKCGAVYMEEGGPFGDCHLHVNEVPLYESCVENVCAFPRDKSVLCDYYKHFAQICGEVDKLPMDWRERIPLDCELEEVSPLDPFPEGSRWTPTECQRGGPCSSCPMERARFHDIYAKLCEFECPEGMLHTNCTPACPRTCAEPNGPENCDMPCIEACVCPEGKLLDKDECVEPEYCGCTLETGEYIRQLSEWISPKCTQKCYCDSNGELQCRNYTCHVNALCVIDENGNRGCQCQKGLKGSGEICVTESGYCQIWGDPHYLTFDGRKYTFQGSCRYTLVKTCKDSDLPEFHLYEENERRTPDSPVSYHKILFLVYNGHEYTVGRNYVDVDRVKITLPLLNHDGVTIHYDVPFTVLETDFGLSIRYSQRTEAEIYLSNEYASLVCGLCGDFDGDMKNDFRMPNGRRDKRQDVFGNSWLVDGDSKCKGKVSDTTTVFYPCQLSTSSRVLEAGELCRVLSPDDDRLASCHQVANPTIYFETCQYDLCVTLPETKILCDSIEEYLVACREGGGNPGNWRSGVPQCPFECPDGFIYSHCGTTCPNTCIERNRTAICNDNCREVCLCPENQILDGDRCVEESECGCLLENGQYISNGQKQVNEDCSQVCSCHSGEVTCTEYSCHESAICDLRKGLRGCGCMEGFIGDGEHCRPATSVCRVWGDPHYVTFDGRKHDFQGECEYSLVETTNELGVLPAFQLYGDNIRMNPDSKGTYLRQLRLVYNGNEFILRRGGGVRLNNNEITLPLYEFDGVTIFLRFPDVILETDFGLQISYNRRAKAEVVLNAEYGGKIGGLCGDLDENKRNDLRLPDGSLTRSVNKFGNSWVTDKEKCTPEDGDDPPSPCKEDPTLMAEAIALCSVLSSQSAVFADCRGSGMEVFIDACTYDLCVTNLNTSKFCDSLQEYASACQDAGGSPGDWQSLLPQCVNECPIGMESNGCGPACPETCADLGVKRNCSTDDCFDTCVCPAGQVLDGAQCVAPEECGCTLSDGLYIQKDSTHVSDNCDLSCTCMGGKLSCFAYSCDTNANCTIDNGFRRCVCMEGFIGNGQSCLARGGNITMNAYHQRSPPITIINCPGDINKTLAICETEATISWQPPTAVSHNGSQVQLVLETEQPGKVYRPGVYGGLYRFQDRHMNVAECTFTINVKSGLQIPDGHCATPEGSVIAAGETYISDDCSQQCLCVQESLVCNGVSCAEFSECAIRNGNRGCYCMDGYSGDGFTCDRTGCPDSFYAFHSSCYYFHAGRRMNFDDARAFCREMGADLPVIQDKAENDFVGHMKGENQKAWLLAKRHEDEDYIVENTGPGFEYKFLADEIPDGHSFLEFSVKANKEAHILLSPGKTLTHRFYEIAIGADDNSKSYLRTCEGCEREFNMRTDGILNPNEHRYFFISITGRTIHFGEIIHGVTQNPTKIFVDRTKDGPLNVKYVGFATFGAKGEWAFYKTTSWLNGEDWTFENWKGSRPILDPTEGHCLQVGYGCPTYWSDSECSELIRVVCEM